MEQLTRSQLFGLISKESNKAIIKTLFRDPDSIEKLFDESSIFILAFESQLLEEKKNGHNRDFLKIFNSNINLITDDNFRGFLEIEILKLEITKNNSLNSFNDCFNQLIRIIAKYHSKIINALYIIPQKSIFIPGKSNGVTQTFLSYAYDDKGVTLGLFFYFLNHGGFLYIDWMWHEKLNGIEIKNSIHEELNKSYQFLFLRSPNSELETSHGERMIRQWCSWEIGNYFRLKTNKKYYTNFYNSKKPSNELLCDFDQAYYVKNGIIH